MKSTDLLRHEHKHLLNALDILAEMARRVERGTHVNRRDTEELLDFIRGYGDRHHQGEEECVVFPAMLGDRAQKDYPSVCGFVFEHNRQRFLIEGLEESLVGKSEKDFVYCARRLNEILRTHIREEEELLFPLLDSRLTPAADDRLVSDMLAFDGTWQKTELSGQLQRLDDLKSKYLH